MAAKSPVALEKKTLNLRKGDWDYIESIYKEQGIDTSFIVRKNLSALVDKIKAKEKPIDPSLK